MWSYFAYFVHVAFYYYDRLTGISPFGVGNTQEVYQKNKNCEIDFPKKLWENVSSEALDLVIAMTNKDQYKRLNAKECLEHKWFSSKFSDNNFLDDAFTNLVDNEGK